MVSIVMWILLGAVVGWLAGRVTGAGHGAPISDVLVGTMGALVGGFIARLVLGNEAPREALLGSLFVAFVGALLTIAFFRALSRPRLHRT